MNKTLELRSITRDEAEVIYNAHLDTDEGQYIRDMFEENGPLYRSYLSVYDMKTIQFLEFARIFDLIEMVLRREVERKE